MPGLPVGPLELIIVLAIALLILGPGRLPELGSAVGKTIREFRKAATDIQEDASLEPKTSTPASSPSSTVVTASGPGDARDTPSTENSGRPA